MSQTHFPLSDRPHRPMPATSAAVVAVLVVVVIAALTAFGGKPAPVQGDRALAPAEAPHMIEDWRGNSASFRPAE